MFEDLPGLPMAILQAVAEDILYKRLGVNSEFESNPEICVSSHFGFSVTIPGRYCEGFREVQGRARPEH